MSPRKRKQPEPAESPTTPSKRTRLQQKSSETASKNSSSYPACKVGKQATIYGISGILDETEDQYLIDWGIPYDPSWQPKKNANVAAVNLWDAKKPFENKRLSDRRSPPTPTQNLGQKRKVHNPSTSPVTQLPVDPETAKHKPQSGALSRQVSARTSPLSAPHSEAERPEVHTASTSRVTPLSLRTPTTEDKAQPGATRSQTPTFASVQKQQSVQAISSSLDISNFPGIAVEIKPRGSLDKEAYTAYHSSLSTQGFHNPASPQSDSGFEESSSSEGSPVQQENKKETVVPDSQSLPGSSSYVPTRATSSNPADSSRVLVSTDLPKSSAGIVIPASEPSNSVSQRGESEPTSYLREVHHTSSEEDTSSPLLQTLSDPEALLESSRAHRFIPRKRPNRRIIIDSPSPPQTLPPEHQPEVLLQSIEPIEEITQVQIPSSQFRLDSAAVENPESSEQSPRFITQAPLEIRNQSSHLSSDIIFKPIRTPIARSRSTPEVWEAGQEHSNARKSTSDISSRSLHPGQLPSIRGKEADTSEYNRAVEYHTSHEQESRATTADVLNLGGRDADPQPQDCSKGGDTHATHAIKERETVLKSPRNLIEGSDFSELQHNPLPDSIDSRVPPEPPRGSDTDMSDAAHATNSPSAEPRMERMKRKIDEARATSDAEIAAAKAKRMQSKVGNASSLPSLKSTELDSKPKPASAIQSPKGPKSPSLARIAVTPKGPLSPVAVGSPLGIQITSPRSARSPSRIPEREPYRPQEEPSFVGVDPTEMAKVLPTPMMASHRPSYPVNDSFRPREERDADESISTQRDLDSRMSLNIQNLGSMEFIIPLSMPPRTQREYLDAYRGYDVRLSTFCEGSDISRGNVEDLNSLLDRISKITNHIDLIGGGADSQDTVNVTDEAGYSADVSEKFRFLGYVLMLARDRDMHIAIISRPGQLCDLIETTIKAGRVNYRRRVGLIGEKGPLRSNTEFGSRLRVSLLASTEEASVYTCNSKKADLVIAFDETFDADSSQVRILRGYSPHQNRLAPVIRLVVYATLEHINLCLPFTLEPNDRLRRLLYHMVDAEKSVGQLAAENLLQSPFNPRYCAEQLVDFLNTGANPQAWSLPRIPPIQNLPVIDYDASDAPKLEEEVQYWPRLVPPRAGLSRRKPGEKRPFDLQYSDSMETQSKKIKLGILSSNGHWEGCLESLKDVKDHERIQELERQLQYANSNSYDPENPMAWQSRVKVLDEANRERRELSATVTDLTSKFEKSNINHNKLRKENDGLKAIINELQAKVDGYHNNLLTSPELQIRESELLRRQVVDLQISDAAKTKKLASAESDLTFTRQAYQEASTAFSAANSELSDLRSHLQVIESQLAAAQLERRTARSTEREKLLPKLREIDALKTTLKQREKEIQNLKAEFDGFKRGRQGVQTRGSSIQPVGARSPRGSRGASPAVSGLVPGHHQGGVPMARGPSGLSGTARLGPQGHEGPKMR